MYQHEHKKNKHLHYCRIIHSILPSMNINARFWMKIPLKTPKYFVIYIYIKSIMEHFLLFQKMPLYAEKAGIWSSHQISKEKSLK